LLKFINSIFAQPHTKFLLLFIPPPKKKKKLLDFPSFQDAVILTAAVQSLAIFTNYAWFLLLLAPARLFWMAWTNFISPWIFAPAPEEEVDEKKQKKMERKMRRAR
jgi:hypothetical protein